eukprot:GHVQ01038199.1.p1 GENE.GHVQ01038199.1~~GHVQ01038199.1.p1  ORF type:complete len:152 (-),score=20.09 GHVQ01038199.1:192-647(-)
MSEGNTNDNHDGSVVEIQGSSEVLEITTSSFADLTTFADDSVRFCSLLPTDEVANQLRDRYRVVKEAGSFTDFAPQNEKELEDWVDANARGVKARRVCVELFQEMWSAAATETLGNTISHADAITYEKLVSEIATKLFPHSRYVFKIEKVL